MTEDLKELMGNYTRNCEDYYLLESELSMQGDDLYELNSILTDKIEEVFGDDAPYKITSDNHCLHFLYQNNRKLSLKKVNKICELLDKELEDVKLDFRRDAVIVIIPYY